MSDLAHTIKRVTKDLEYIQEELNHAARFDASAPARERVMEQMMDVDMIQNLKAAVDNMRQLLWSYIEASSKEGKDVGETLQSLRMQRVTDMLRILKPDLEEDRLKRAPETQTFLEMVTSIAHSAVEKHGRTQGPIQ
jgi:hypothetical protein